MILVYCDTDTLWNNVERQASDYGKSANELTALGRLFSFHKAGRCSLLRSRVALRELDRTKNQKHREKLRADYDALDQIQNDERLQGFQTSYDQNGGFISNPIISDVQDETLCKKLQDHGLSVKDAEHLTQAICNKCDVFLTRDESTIINPHRDWIESNFSPLKVRLPSEFVKEFSSCAGGAD